MVFRSGHGVAANALTNRLGRDTTLFSHGEAHDARRKVLMRSVAAKLLKSLHRIASGQAAPVCGPSA
ncbi:MAG: hypothetical protein ACYDC2_04030 [Solirubrobacteraceae bacterium]